VTPLKRAGRRARDNDVPARMSAAVVAVTLTALFMGASIGLAIADRELWLIVPTAGFAFLMSVMVVVLLWGDLHRDRDDDLRDVP
jgi:hypothetical protein